jgi:hypothetical protein
LESEKRAAEKRPYLYRDSKCLDLTVIVPSEFSKSVVRKYWNAGNSLTRLIIVFFSMTFSRGVVVVWEPVGGFLSIGT